jgi:UDP-N-acetylmuramate dehydrogenase
MPLILQEDVSLKALNSFGVEARAAWAACIRNLEELEELRGDARVQDLPRLILGGGSNVLFARDFDGLVVQMAIAGVEDLGWDGDARLIRAGAGESWPALVEALVRDGHAGVENLALIPGSAGAAPIQNIGAYGLEIAERLHAVSTWDWASGAKGELEPQQCGFGYRDSVFKRDRPGERIITSITLRLPRDWQPVTGYAELERELARTSASRGIEAKDVFEAVCALRRRKLPDPATLGNAGSFFKNPIVARDQHARLIDRYPSLVSYPLAGGRFKLAAGWLVEASGLKGITRGRAGVYEKQALVIVNRGGASGRDILALAGEIQATVFERFGVALEPEAVIV